MKKPQRANKSVIRYQKVVGIGDSQGVKLIRDPSAAVHFSTILEVETRRERIRTVEEYEKQRSALIALIYR